jgi:hypothetical protein
MGRPLCHVYTISRHQATKNAVEAQGLVKELRENLNARRPKKAQQGHHHDDLTVLTIFYQLGKRFVITGSQNRKHDKERGGLEGEEFDVYTKISMLALMPKVQIR